MNVLQQEALAAAMGMQGDQLENILYKQEIQGKTARELRALGKEDLADRLEATTAQDKFNKTMEKLQSLIADIVAPLIPLLDMLDPIFTLIGGIFMALDPLIKAIQFILTGIVDIFGLMLGGDFSATAAAGKAIGTSIEDNYMKPFGMKDGGRVKSKPGGVNVTLAEGGEDEFVIPGSKIGKVGASAGVGLTKEDMIDAMVMANEKSKPPTIDFSQRSLNAPHGLNVQFMENNHQSKVYS